MTSHIRIAKRNEKISKLALNYWRVELHKLRTKIQKKTSNWKCKKKILKKIEIKKIEMKQKYPKCYKKPIKKLNNLH